MSSWEIVGACITGAVGLVWLAFAVLDWRIRHRTIRRFPATARQAARRTEADVHADRAAARTARDLVEQHALDLTFTQIIATEFPTIPHQTRRTEEDQ